MQTVLITIHLLVILALIGVVLLQRSEGGGLGLGGGGGGGVSGFLTGRGQANALTRATTILGAAFFATSLALTLLAGYGRAPRSILDGAAGVPATTAPGGTGNALEDLQRFQQERAPAAPATPQAPFSR